MDFITRENYPLKNAKNELFMQNLYIKKSKFFTVTKESWKCFRCNLFFDHLSHAKIHEELTNHKVTLVKNVTA